MNAVMSRVTSFCFERKVSCFCSGYRGSWDWGGSEYLVDSEQPQTTIEACIVSQSTLFSELPVRPVVQYPSQP